MRKMKKRSGAHTAIVLSLLLCLLTGCTFGRGAEQGADNADEPPASDGETQGGRHPSAEGLPGRLTPEEDKIYLSGGAEGFYSSNGYSNGDPFNCVWRSDCVRFEDGAMHMSVRREGGGFAGAEYRSRGYYSYGFYSVSMKAAKCSGVISSFFTYTGHPWDEIDFEFLGKDTTEIQLNYYTKGQGGHEYLYRLGFDGAEDFHEYGFLWLPDSITWYVDGMPVYRATENIPTTETQIMMNVWNCKGIDGWSGAFDESSLPATASYQWIGYSPYRA